jgi:uncharacterized membrane protein YfcA
MDPLTTLFLGGTGFLGGIITAVVGGSSIICFPAMLAAGLPPVVASASNTTAVVPASLIAAYSDSGRAPTWSTEVLGLALVGFVGSALGAMLLVVLPSTVFVAIRAKIEGKQQAGPRTTDRPKTTARRGCARAAPRP